MADDSISIIRVTTATPDALHLLHEYYEAINVVVRDTDAYIAEICEDPNSGVWLAYKNTDPIGCVVLRPLPQISQAAECKRLYVRPSARGLGAAAALMDALESHATNIHFEWIYLDSKDDLRTAITLYRNRGYEDCPRYNDNPQATIFLRKRLLTPPL